jgi:hypothetical protein
VFSRHKKIDDGFRKLLPEAKLIDDQLLVDADTNIFLTEDGCEIRLSSREVSSLNWDPHTLDLAAVHKYRMFHLLYCQSSRILTLTSDRFSTYLLFYYLDEDIFLLSSSFEVLLSLLRDQPRSLNLQAASELIDFGYLMYGKTLVDGIRRYPYATQFKISPEDITNVRYWDFKFNEKIDDPENLEALKLEFGRHLVDAITQCLPAASDVVIPLSGGMDSRLILAVALETINRSRITLFTFGQEGTQDLEIARQISNDLGVRHILEIIPDEASSDLANIDWTNTYLERIKVNHGISDSTPYSPSLSIYKQLTDFGAILLSGYIGGQRAGGGACLTPAMLTAIQDYDESYQSILNREQNNPLYSTLIGHQISRPPNELLKKLKGYQTVAGFNIYWAHSVREQDYIKFGQLFKLASIFEIRTPFIEPNLFEFLATQIPLKQKLSDVLYAHTNLEFFPSLYGDYSSTTTKGLRLTSPAWQQSLVSIMSKFNSVSRQRVFPIYRKLNYLDYKKVAAQHPKYKKFLLANCLDLLERGNINEQTMKILQSNLEGDYSLVKIMGRLSTLNLCIEQYNLV